MSAFIEHLPDLLARLDTLWAEQGAPISQYAAPGLDDEEIDRLAASSGVVVPPELRVWWGWHNGVLDHPAEELEASTIVTYYDMLSLEMALELRANILAIPRSDPNDPVMGDWFWRDSWLLFTGWGNNSLYVDTTKVVGGELSPVFRSDPMWDEGWNLPVATSFTAAVATIVRVIEEGYFGWSKSEHAWVVLKDDLPWDIDYRFF